MTDDDDEDEEIQNVQIPIILLLLQSVYMLGHVNNVAWGSHGGAAEVSGLLGCEAGLLGKSLLTFFMAASP